MRLAGTLLLALLVSGCVTRDAAQHQQCSEMGYKPGTELYLQCRSMVAQTDAQRRAARLAFGAQMLQPAPRSASMCSGQVVGNSVMAMCQ